MQAVRMLKQVLTGTAALLLVPAVFGGNPVLKEGGLSGPRIHTFDGKHYLYAAHDAYSDAAAQVRDGWRIYVSDNLGEWKPAGEVLPKQNYMSNNSMKCGSCDAATKNTRYYFYFSDGEGGIGVMTGGKPYGPFQDVVGKPIVKGATHPGIFMEADGSETNYLLFRGEDGEFRIAKLKSNMIALDEEPSVIEVYGDEWEATKDAPVQCSIFKQGKTYLLIWGNNYAVSDSLKGPYECVGSVGNGRYLDKNAQSGLFERERQFYFVWSNFLKPGYESSGSFISYCSLINGKLKTDSGFLRTWFGEGVGRYHAGWPRIEAEWYAGAHRNVEKQVGLDDDETPVVSGIEHDGWLYFPNVDFGSGATGFTGRMASEKKGGLIEIREGSIDGPILGEVDIPETPSNYFYENASCKFDEPVSGVKDIYFVFLGRAGTLLNFNWFTFDGIEKQALPAVPASAVAGKQKKAGSASSPAPVYSVPVDGSFIVEGEDLADKSEEVRVITKNAGYRVVGYITPGSRLEYEVVVPNEGRYEINFHYSKGIKGSSGMKLFEKNNPGKQLGVFEFESTGNFDDFGTMISSPVHLQKGRQTLVLEAYGSEKYVADIDKMTFIPVR